MPSSVSSIQKGKCFGRTRGRTTGLVTIFLVITSLEEGIINAIYNVNVIKIKCNIKEPPKIYCFLNTYVIITCCSFVMASMAFVSVDKDLVSDNTSVNVAIWARSSTSVNL